MAYWMASAEGGHGRQVTGRGDWHAHSRTLRHSSSRKAPTPPVGPGTDGGAVSPGVPVRAQDRAGHVGAPGEFGMASWQGRAGRGPQICGTAVYGRTLSRLLSLGNGLEGPGG